MATDPEELLREAEDLIEDWLCELDQTWTATLDGARAQAADIVALARLEAESIIAEANATAGEHADVIRALTTAEREAAGEELASLREAVNRLRAELSRLVDAAFDAIPAVEATAAAIDDALGEDPEPDFVWVDAPPAPRGRRRFLLFGRRR